MKRLFLFFTFFSAVSLQAFSQGILTPSQLRAKADSLFKLDDRAATNRKSNIWAKAIIANLGSGGSATLLNRITNYGSIEVVGSTVEYEGITAVFGDTTYGPLEASSIPITTPADDSTSRIDLVVINSNGTLAVLTGIPSNNPIAPKPQVASQLAIGEIYFNFGGTGSGSPVVFASQEEMNNGVAGKIPDAAVVKEFVLQTVSEALDSLNITPGVGIDTLKYIPRAGTLSGYPITGVFQTGNTFTFSSNRLQMGFSNDTEIVHTAADPDDERQSSLVQRANTFQFTVQDALTTPSLSDVRITNDGLLIQTGDILGGAYRFPNSPLHYVQKQYVDSVAALGGGGGTSNNADSLNSQPGSYYLNRANHTGTQGANTIGTTQLQTLSVTNAIINDVAMPKVTGLQSALDLKANASDVAANTIGVLSVRETITQNAHGLSAFAVVRYNGTAWVTASSSSEANSEALGVVESVTTNTFVIVYVGKITGLSLTANTQYFLSSTGTLTATEPSTEGTVSKAVLRTTSASTGIVNIQNGNLN